MINLSIYSLTLLPIYTGIALALFSKKEKFKKRVTLLVFFLSLLSSLYLFSHPNFVFSQRLFPGYVITLALDQLSRLILILGNLLGCLICLYSQEYMQGKKNYFSFLLWLLAFANLEILATHFYVFIFAWGFSIAILYSLLRLGSKFNARKALVILGFSYICFIMGAYLYSSITGSNHMPMGANIPVNRLVCWLAFVFMLVGALAKTGSGPMHTWIPAASESAPIPVMGILPASLDKLLGIYILCRICLDFFKLNSLMMTLLLLIGSLTIIFAVMMALIQHDARVLLAYHSISQAGYMIVGIGTGSPIGIIGALFHMVNNALYKNGLFLVCGAVKKQKKSFRLDQLGGLASFMPLTFISALVFSLAISGVPPFNGFFSKWLIYKGIIDGLNGAANIPLRFVFIFSLISAMFGSILTLASFIKFIHAIFLGQNHCKDTKDSGETPIKMLIPLLTLAGFCIALGAFSHLFIKKYLNPYFATVGNYTCMWDGITIFMAIILAVLIGYILWRFTHAAKIRVDSSFVGGEPADVRFDFPATEFYKTIENIPHVQGMYRFLHSDGLDVYNIIKSLFWFRRKKKSHPKLKTGMPQRERTFSEP